MFIVSFIGNVGKTPEQRQSSNGADYTSFSVAIRTRDPEQPEWAQIQVWGKLGLWALEHIERGSSVWIAGQADINRWENRDGKEVAMLNVRADVVRFAGAKPQDDGNRGQSRNRDRSGGQRRRPPPSEEPF